jgi:hypothetical protein
LEPTRSDMVYFSLQAAPNTTIAVVCGPRHSRRLRESSRGPVFPFIFKRFFQIGKI